jgi:hypothetical protein
MTLRIVSCPVPGTYLVHEHDQRPVEGVAVHRYREWWACERCGPVTDARRDCEHIGLVKKGGYQCQNG